MIYSLVVITVSSYYFTLSIQYVYELVLSFSKTYVA